MANLPIRRPYRSEVQPMEKPSRAQKQVELSVRLDLLLAEGYHAKARAIQSIQQNLSLHSYDLVLEVVERVRAERASRVLDDDLEAELAGFELGMVRRMYAGAEGVDQVVMAELEKILQHPNRPDEVQLRGFWQRLLVRE